MAKLKSGNRDELHFDDKNINKGANFGMELLGKSITETGLGRSLVSDKNGVLISGNKTLAAADALGIKKIVFVETTGDEIIVLKRTDLDINSPKGIKAKILDNTVSVHSYVEDAEIAETLCEEAEIMNTNDYGLKSRAEDEQNVSFKASTKAIIKIELTSKEQLAGAEKDLNYLMNQKYPGAKVMVKGK